MLTLLELSRFADLDVDDSVGDMNEGRSEFLLSLLRRVTRDDEFISMSTEAQLLFMYLILESGTGKDRPRALCRMLFHENKDMFGTPQIYPYEPYDELVRKGFIPSYKED